MKDRLKGVLKQVCQNKGQSGLVELLQCSVQHLQSAELQVFLAQHYLEMGAYVQNNELNAFLIREGIICAHTFSKCLATWVLELLNATEKDTQMVYSLFEFLKEVLLTQKLFAPRVFDELIKALRHKMNSGLFSHSEIILSQLQEMQALDSLTSSISRHELESFFNEFMELSQTRTTSKDEIDNFFKKLLEKLQLRDSAHITLFCDTLAPYSIKRAFEFPNGEKRFLDRLDFCWIDGFIKLVFSLISAVQSINK